MASKEEDKKKKKDEVAGWDPDTLNLQDLRRISERVFRILGRDPDIVELFENAFAGEYEGAGGKERFWSDMENMDWWNRHSSQVRRYVILSADPENRDFIRQQEDSREFVRRQAMQIGMNLSDEQLNELAEESLMYGWGEQGQEYRLREAIMGMEPQGEYGGDIAANAEALKTLALANGVKYDEDWYLSAGKSIASDASTPEEWQRQIRDLAASKFPVFSDQIQAGVSVRQLASPYIQTMAEVWELNPASITLDDPTLMGALSSYDDKGNPKSVGLGDFMRQLRRDPRWMDTDAAQNEITGVAAGVMQMFGMMGR